MAPLIAPCMPLTSKHHIRVWFKTIKIENRNILLPYFQFRITQSHPFNLLSVKANKAVKRSSSTGIKFYGHLKYSSEVNDLGCTDCVGSLQMIKCNFVICSTVLLLWWRSVLSVEAVQEGDETSIQTDSRATRRHFSFWPRVHLQNTNW